jgi:protein-tyrosine phosphatase
MADVDKEYENITKKSKEIFEAMTTLKKHKPINQMTKNCFISNFRTAKDIALLKSKKITKILCLEAYCNNVMEDVYIEEPEMERELVEIEDIPYKQIQLLREKLIYCHNFLNTYSNENILIHCMAGISRSALVLMYHILHSIYEKTGKVASIEEIAKYLCAKRPICPNMYFVKVLLIEEHVLLEKGKPLDDPVSKFLD